MLLREFHSLLTENGLDRVMTTFGPRLEQRYRDDTGEQASASTVIDMIAQCDPTPKHEYTFWLAKTYLAGAPLTLQQKHQYEMRGQPIPPNLGIKRFEDLGSRAKPALRKFDAAKRAKKLSPEDRDLNRFKSFRQLEDVAKNLGDEEIVSNRQIKANRASDLITSKQAELVYEDAELRIVSPKTEEASCYFGMNTKWCTAAREDNQFSEYSSDGPLYIILWKEKNERWQAHFGTNSLMDEQDDEASPIQLGLDFPQLYEVFGPIAERAGSIMFNKNPSAKTQMKAADYYVADLRHLENIDPKVQESIVDRNPWNVKYIINPTRSVQEFLVRKNGSDLMYLQHMDEDLVLKAIKAQKFVYLPPKYQQNKKYWGVAIRDDEHAIEWIIRKYGKNTPPDLVRLAVELRPYCVVDAQIEDPKMIALALSLDFSLKDKLHTYQMTEYRKWRYSQEPETSPQRPVERV